MLRGWWWSSMEARIASNKDTTECATNISGGAGSGCWGVERIGAE
jgi:hypothetical protein